MVFKAESTVLMIIYPFKACTTVVDYVVFGDGALVKKYVPEYVQEIFFPDLKIRYSSKFALTVFVITGLLRTVRLETSHSWP